MPGAEWGEAANGAGPRTASSPLPQQLQHRPGVPQEQAGKDLTGAHSRYISYSVLACWVSILKKRVPQMQAGKFLPEEHTRCISHRNCFFHLQFFQMACWVSKRAQEVNFFQIPPWSASRASR